MPRSASDRLPEIFAKERSIGKIQQVGNLIDRVMLNYVRDFIYFKIINFPVFNVADICVSLSMVALVVVILFVYKDADFYFLKKKKAEQTEDEQ